MFFAKSPIRVLLYANFSYFCLQKGVYMEIFDYAFDTFEGEMKEPQLVLHNEISDIGKVGETYITKHLIIILNHYGYIKFDYDLQSEVLYQHNNCVIYPEHIVTIKEMSPDFSCSVLIVSNAFLNHLRQLHPNHYRAEYHYTMAFHLTDEQFQTIQNCFQLLNAISVLDSNHRDELLAQQMDITANLAEMYFHINNDAIFAGIDKKEQVVSHFFAAIAAHFRESREVKFYAEKLCLSPRYFGTIVRDATGISAHKWITQYVTTQAKDALQHHPEWSIQEVAEWLGFPDQAIFSRYFKAATGTSPTEYRELKH